MNYKKTVALILFFLMISVLFACAGGKPSDTSTSAATAAATEAPTEKATETEAATEPVEPYSGTLEIDIRPVPASARFSLKGEDSAPAALLTPSDNGYGEIFESFGFSTGDNGLPVLIDIDPSLDEEEYKLTVQADKVGITASGRRGVFAAISTLAQLEYNGRLAAAVIEDSPTVPYRGVIEGFYGVAWTHQFRLDLFDFMGKYKLNTYIYAPKDDPKHRSEWRSLYTKKELEKMTELVSTAIKNNVRFVYAISPGLDIDLGAGYEADFAKLCEKCESMYAIGVRDFAILLDDIPTLDAKGHAMLCNDFQSKFVKTHDGCTDLIMITPEFCEAMLTHYTDSIAPLIDPDIMVMWTGDYVLPQSITPANLRNITQKLGRTVYIWWNYPVNDTMGDQLFMGPCVNLGKTLYSSISGLVSNPMNQGYASEVPLITISDYLWNPSAYDPEASVAAAVKLVEPKCSDGLYALMDLTRTSAINNGKTSLSLRDDIDAYNKKADGAAEKLLARFEKMRSDLDQLQDLCRKELKTEIKQWLSKAISLTDAAIAFLRFELSDNTAERAEYAMQFIYASGQAEANGKKVSPDVLVPFLSSARPKINSAVGGGSAVTGVTASATFYTYDVYYPSYAVDGDSSTFFWSAGSPQTGNSFTLDLGKVTDVSSVCLLMGVDDHANDYLRSAVIEYSEDGKTYKELCKTTGRITEKAENFSARYVRLRCTAPQEYWLIIPEFSVIPQFDMPEGVVFDGGGKFDLSSLFDKNLFSCFSPEPAMVTGRTLRIDASKYTSADLYLESLDGIRIYTDKTDSIKLSRYMQIDLSDVEYLCIEFENRRASISEIVIK